MSDGFAPVGTLVVYHGSLPEIAHGVYLVTEVVETLAGYTHTLADPQPGVHYVVSLITAQSAPHRTDLLVPSRQIRDEQGRIIGCAGLGRIPTAGNHPR